MLVLDLSSLCLVFVASQNNTEKTGSSRSTPVWVCVFKPAVSATRGLSPVTIAVCLEGWGPVIASGHIPLRIWPGACYQLAPPPQLGLDDTSRLNPTWGLAWCYHPPHPRGRVTIRDSTWVPGAITLPPG